MWKTEREKFIPTMEEWQALRSLWARSLGVLASTLAPSAHARAAWTAKTFVSTNERHSLHQVLGWIQANLEISGASSPEIEIEAFDVEEAKEVKDEVEITDDLEHWHDVPTRPGYVVDPEYLPGTVSS